MDNTVNPINLVGMQIGNGLTSTEDDLGKATYADFGWWHALYGQTTRDNYEKYCLTDSEGADCDAAIAVMQEETKNVNPYDIYKWCWHEESLNSPKPTHRQWMNRFNDPEPLRADPDGIPCIDVRGSTYLFNQKDWRTAFNVGDSTVHWNTCVFPPALNYTMGESI